MILKQTKYIKKLNKILNSYISKDDTRPALKGVIHNSQLSALCSTNGYAAAVLKSLYNPKLKDIILTKDYQTIDISYPNIKNILPTRKDYKYSVFAFDEKFCVKTKHITSLFFYILNDKPTISFDIQSNCLFCLDAAYLAPLLDGSSYNVAYKQSLDFVVINLNNKTDFEDSVVIAPLTLTL